MRLRSESAVPQTASLAHSNWLAGLILAAASVAVLAACWPTVWLVLPIDGLYVLALLLSAAGWGSWPATWLRPHGQSTGRQVCLATALGLGILSTATLALGVAGVLSRPLVCALLVAGAALGAVRLARTGIGLGRKPVANGRGVRKELAKALVLLPLCVPIAVVLYGACLPPGLLWTGEARGYDVLEYHLQAPREYYDAGQIQFLPNNVYASFPLGVETLYLLLMYLAGGPLAAAIPAQLLHAALGALTVAALVAWTPRGWPRILVALVAGTTVWLAYLGALAYVELGVLFFAAVAAGLIVSEDPGPRVALAAGICAGLAAGCKYTALALVAAALGLAWLITMRGGVKIRASRLAMYSLGAVLAFSPWLIRNAAFTGNPVYPFAYGWFGGRDWSAAQAEQWQRGHAMPPESSSVPARARIAFEELFNSGMYNQALWLLGLGGLALLAVERGQSDAAEEARPAGGRRQAAALALWAVLIVLAWAAFTRMPGRFATPVIIPLALLLGHAAAQGASARRPLGAGATGLASIRRPRVLAAFIGFAVAGAILGDVRLVTMLREEAARWLRVTGVPLKQMIDRADLMRETNPIDTAVPPGAYVWIVGDARVFYVARRCHYTVDFNSDPWLQFAAHSDPAASVAWLRTHGVTHVVFSWSEIERLRQSYGFPALVTPAWVESLAKSGLTLVSSDRDQRGVAFEVYEVVPE
jgi:hypothetical protein